MGGNHGKFTFVFPQPLSLLRIFSWLFLEPHCLPAAPSQGVTPAAGGRAGGGTGLEPPRPDPAGGAGLRAPPLSALPPLRALLPAALAPTSTGGQGDSKPHLEKGLLWSTAGLAYSSETTETTKPLTEIRYLLIKPS